MADYRTTGVHQINHWLWNKLQGFEYDGQNLAFSKYGTGADQVNLTPIIPSQQQPEFVDIAGGAPFIVYNYTIAPGTDWWILGESCAYVIYDNDEERLRSIHAYMVDLFKREDWVAQEINDFFPNSPFDFKHSRVTTATGPDASSDEGGRQSAMVVIRYEYTRDLDQSGLRL